MKLASDEFAQIREWILDRKADQWDLQIERDVTAGRLDHLFEQALEDDRDGKCIQL